MATSATSPIEAAGADLLKLAAWMSPAFPTSGYAHSHGLEWAVAARDVVDLPSLIDWTRVCVRQGAGRNDAILLGLSWRAWARRDADGLAALVEVAEAFQPSAERREETLSQGSAFWRTARAAWPAEPTPPLPDEVAYPVAVGAVSAAHGAPRLATTALYLHSFAGVVASAAQRLVPIGQTDAQRALAALADDALTTATEADALGLDDLGGSALGADIASMRHETQTVRLFRT